MGHFYSGGDTVRITKNSQNSKCAQIPILYTTKLLYFLVQLKRASVPTTDLTNFYVLYFSTLFEPKTPSVL